MDCAICFQPLDSGKSPAVPLRCLHKFHELCLEASCKARGLHSIQAMKCPTCKLTDSEVAEKQAKTQFLGAGDASTRSVPEIWSSQSSQDDHGAAQNQAAAPTQDALFHGSSSKDASRNSPVTVEVPVAPGGCQVWTLKRSDSSGKTPGV